MRMRILVMLLVAAVTVASAQQKKSGPKSKGASAAPASSQMNAPQSAEMQKLEKMFGGTWTLDEQFEPMEGMPAGKGTGTEVVRRGPGGNSLVMDEKSTSAVGSFTGHGLMWYDAKAGGYRSIWCDTMTAKGCEDSGVGKWQGDKLVFEFESEMPPEMGGGSIHMIETFSDIKPASFTFSMDGTMNEHKMHMMTVKYKKAGGVASKP